MDGTLYAPLDVPGGLALTGTPWTPLSQTTTGTGSPADPYTIVTDVAAGATGVTLTQTDTYVVGSESVRTTDVIHNGSHARSVTLYRAGDCFLNDSDSGLGQVNRLSGAVACKSPGSGRIEQWLPLSPGSHFYEAEFGELWTAVNSMAPFPDTCRCSEPIDNGAGLSWTAALSSDARATRSSLITFSPTGAAPLTLSATVAPGQVGPGGEVTYQVTVSNSGNAPTMLTSLTDTLPAGFGYLPGTTTGIATTDPQVSGDQLTWPLTTSVPAQSDLTLRFHATAAQTAGTYVDQASGTSATVEVVGITDAAPVTVGPVDTTPPHAVDDLTASPGDQEVDLDWVNPTDPDLDRIRVFYQSGSTPPAFGAGTEVTLGPSAPEQAQVAGLDDGTLYSFAVYAVDAAGNVSDPGTVLATPNAATGVDPVRHLQASAVSPTSATLTWDNPASLDGIVVRYAADAPPATVTSGTGVPVAGTPERVTVTGLTPDTHSYFSVFATDSGNASPPTSVDLTPFSCPDLSGALSAPSGLVTGSSWEACSAPDASATSTLSTVLPRVGPTEALMTTGDADLAAPPDGGPAQGRDNHTGSRGAHDVSIYRLDLDVPGGSQCLSFDYVFASDEYPESIGSTYNDGFVAQLDRSDWKVSSGSVVTAPGNFAKTPGGGLVDVNGPVFATDSSVVGPGANGTSYDGMSMPLTASTPITPGQHSVYLSIFDAGNGLVDSAVLVDHLQVSSNSCQAGTLLAPHAVDDFATTPSGTPVSTDVLANDSDPGNEDLSVTAHTDGTSGTVSCTATTCTYEPQAGFVGTDSYTYTVANTDGRTATATVSVAVANRPPDAVHDTASTTAGHGVSVDVTANDSDPEGQALTVTASTDGAHGTVSCGPSSCHYTPDPGFTGVDTFGYTVSDAYGASATATVTVTVSPPQPPNAGDDTATTPSGSAVTTDVLANDTDPAGEPLTVTDHSNGTHGSVACTLSTCTYTPAAGYVGTDTYPYTVTNTDGLTDAATVTVTVTNRPPHAVADVATTPTGGTATTSVLANDTDPEGQSLTVAGHTDGAHGTVTCTASSCTYLPADGFVGTDSYTYTVSDGHGGTDTGTVSVTVTDVPTAVTITPSATSVGWPGTVTVTGTVTGSTGPLAGVPVELWAQPAGGSFARIATVVSGADGSVSRTHRPSTETTYQWRVDAVVSPTAVVAVTPEVTLTAPAAAPVGGTVTFKGLASPVRPGATVQLQQLVSGTWTTVTSGTFGTGSTSTSSGAGYGLTVALSALGSQRFRAVVPDDGGRLQGTSATVAVSVLRVAITGMHAKGDEYVTVKNTGPVSAHLRGWVLRSRSGHRTLPTWTLKKGATLRIHTGKGRSHGQDLYLGGKSMLGDKHDSVTLLDARGLRVAHRTY
ncbi:MAG: Ig-like domain-containing protein [Nocardioides sp.]